jgi:hypothetical protein
VLRTLGRFPAKFHRKIFDDLLEFSVSIPALQQLHKVFSQTYVFGHTSSPPPAESDGASKERFDPRAKGCRQNQSRTPLDGFEPHLELLESTSALCRATFVRKFMNLRKSPAGQWQCLYVSSPNLYIPSESGSLPFSKTWTPDPFPTTVLMKITFG